MMFMRTWADVEPDRLSPGSYNPAGQQRNWPFPQVLHPAAMRWIRR